MSCRRQDNLELWLFKVLRLNTQVGTEQRQQRGEVYHYEAGSKGEMKVCWEVKCIHQRQGRSLRVGTGFKYTVRCTVAEDEYTVEAALPVVGLEKT